jgi:phosphoribosyl isomerase A
MPARTQLIPVIDLLGGQVVRGVRGDRQAYRPIVSALCGSSVPREVAQRLCEHCDARQLYVADLDALMGGALQVGTLRELLRALPAVEELWLDGGFADAAAAAALVAALGRDGDRVVPVFGSESADAPYCRWTAAMAGAWTRPAAGTLRRCGRSA